MSESLQTSSLPRAVWGTPGYPMSNDTNDKVAAVWPRTFKLITFDYLPDRESAVSLQPEFSPLVRYNILGAYLLCP